MEMRLHPGPVIIAFYSTPFPAANTETPLCCSVLVFSIPSPVPAGMGDRGGEYRELL